MFLIHSRTSVSFQDVANSLIMFLVFFRPMTNTCRGITAFPQRFNTDLIFVRGRVRFLKNTILINYDQLGESGLRQMK